MSYSNHLKFAMGIVWNLLQAAAVLCVHALLPGVFEKTASEIIGRIFTYFKRSGKKILVNVSVDPYRWVVNVDGEESFTDQVTVNVPCRTLRVADDFFMECYGEIEKLDNHIIIK